MKILVVGEDLAKKAVVVLESANMAVTLVSGGEEAEEMATLYAFDAMVLAQTNPNLEHSVKKIRKAGITLPLLVLSKVSSGGVKADVLDAGADDYVVDPFHAAEFVARLHAIVRRVSGFACSEIMVGELSITLGQVGIARAKGEVFKLTRTTFMMLEMFMLRPNVVFSREQILDRVWKHNHVDERSVDVHMGRLRRPLEERGVDYFETVRSAGYMFCTPKKQV